MATLADIAKKCGTSTATVSYVLNGQGEQRRISSSMQERIRAAAEELGYRQKSVKEKRAPRICVFWPEKNLETSLTNVITGVNTALYLENSPVELSIVPFGYNSLITQKAIWSAKFYDACIILSPNTADIETLSHRRAKIPTVLMNRSLPGYSCVTTDYIQVGRLAAEHAIAKGGEDIAVVNSNISLMGMSQRSREVYNVCSTYGIDASQKAFYCSNNIDEAYELGVRMLRMNPLPKVILCVYDTVAFGLIRAFNEAGIRVGQDVEVLATSSSYPQFFAKSTPSITVVDMKLTEVSQRATRLAIDIATGRIDRPTEIIIPPEIIYRESSPMPSMEQLQRLIERKRKYMVKDKAPTEKR